MRVELAPPRRLREAQAFRFGPVSVIVEVPWPYITYKDGRADPTDQMHYVNFGIEGVLEVEVSL